MVHLRGKKDRKLLETKDHNVKFPFDQQIQGGFSQAKQQELGLVRNKSPKEAD